MNRLKIAAILAVRLTISIMAIYFFGIYYPYSQSLLSYSYGILIGTGVMLLDPRGCSVIVRITPIGSNGYSRMTSFFSRQIPGLSRWSCSVNANGTGKCQTYIPAICGETFSLFGRILAWEIYDEIAEPKNAGFSISVENGVVRQ